MVDLAEVRNAGTKGKGLFAKQPIKQGELIMDLEVPIMRTVYHNKLDLVCEYCYSIEPKEVVCSGCNYVSYCDSECEKNAWQAYHQFECLTLKHMYEGDLMHTKLRSVLRLVFLRDNDKLSDDTFAELLDLCSHSTQLSARHSSDYNKWTQLVRELTGTPLSHSTITKLFSIISSNQWEIASPMDDTQAVGCKMYLKYSRANHSCEPNSKLRRRPTLSTDMEKRLYGHRDKLERQFEKIVVARRDIAAGEEITVTYWDTDLPVEERKADLLRNWHFDCNCTKCIREEAETKLKQLQVVADATNTVLDNEAENSTAAVAA